MMQELLAPRAVFVAWRDPIKHRCYPVGRLARMPAEAGKGEYEFAYVRGVQGAQEAGFDYIVSFDKLDVAYRSNGLFPFFANRVMSDSRPELPALLKRMMLERADPLEILSRTGGIRATDSYEVFPLPRLDAQDGGFRTLFLVHALRHFPESTHKRIESLRMGDQLYLMKDCQNEFDPYAMALRTQDRILVGHIPNYLLLEVYKLEDLCAYLDFTVAKVNPLPAPLDQRLLCELRTCWPFEYVPYVNERFQPIADDAVPTSVLTGDFNGGVAATLP